MILLTFKFRIHSRTNILLYLQIIFTLMIRHYLRIWKYSRIKSHINTSSVLYCDLSSNFQRLSPRQNFNLPRFIFVLFKIQMNIQSISHFFEYSSPGSSLFFTTYCLFRDGTFDFDEKVGHFSPLNGFKVRESTPNPRLHISNDLSY